MVESNYKVRDTIREMVRSIKNQNDGQIINNDDKRRIFSGLNEFNLKLNESDVENCAFNENNRFMGIEKRLDYLVQMLKYGNFYSERILDEIYNFLIQTFRLFLAN